MTITRSSAIALLPLLIAGPAAGLMLELSPTGYSIDSSLAGDYAYPDGGNELLDGVLPTYGWDMNVNMNAHKEVYVGWQRYDPQVTFSFADSVELDRLTIWADDANGRYGVAFPIGATIAMGGESRTFSIANPSGNIPTAFSFEDLDLSGSEVTLTLDGGSNQQWVMLGEVALETQVDPLAAQGAIEWQGNGHAYEFVNESLTWDEAREAAGQRAHQGMRGHLATITSQAEQDFIYQTGQAFYPWIGASDAEQEGTWLWATGPEAGTQLDGPGTPVGAFNYWAPGEPNGDSGEDYGIFAWDNFTNPTAATGRWNDGGGAGYSYLVEYSLPAAITTTNSATLDNAGLLRNLEGDWYSNQGILNNLSGASVENQLGGLFGNLGRIDNLNGSSFSNQGRLRNLGGSLFGNAGTLTNQTGAQFENTGALNNLLGGSMFNSGTLENRGTLDNAGTFTNTGHMLGALGGSMFNSGTLENRGTLDNAGTFTNSGHMLGALGGSMFNSGTLENRGTLDNTGTLTNTGHMLGALGGSMFNSGTLENQGAFDNRGTYNNMLGGLSTNLGTFVNDSSNTVNNAGIFDNSGTLINTTSGVFNNTGTVNNLSGGELLNAGLFNNSGVIGNQGSVIIEGTGILDGSGGYLQQGGSTRVDGLLSSDDLRIDGGTLSGDGAISSANLIEFGSGSMLEPGNGSSGSLEILGDLSLAGTLRIEVFGDADFDRLLVQGDLSFLTGSIIDLVFTYQPVLDVSLLILEADNLFGLNDASVTISGLSGSGYGFTTAGGDLWLDVNGSGTQGTAPEPSAAAILLTTLPVMVFLRRKRDRDARRQTI